MGPLVLLAAALAACTIVFSLLRRTYVYFSDPKGEYEMAA